ncbi:MAG: isoprenylcysteine carboxylmethyltransferase family protein [Ruminococcus sp.]|nr:isoprenylcysteine carboxylmethyltransferase family protein [Ruminococcus sp.]
MDKKLILETLGKFLAGILILMILVFAPAGLGFERGWIFMGFVIVPLIIIIALMLTQRPDLLESRKPFDAKEFFKKKETIIFCAVVVVLFVMCGLSNRFKWAQVGSTGMLVGTVFFLAGYAMFLEVLRENDMKFHFYELIDNLELKDTGLYGIIRHPMYTASAIMMIFVWLMLGSYIAFGISFIYLALVVVKIIFEEKELDKEMPGYTDYKTFVKYRMIPFIW